MRYVLFLLCLFAAILPVNAQAAGAAAASASPKILTVDYSRAIQEIEEGKAAQARLDKMYEGKKAEIEQMENDIRALQQEYQSKASLLTDAAKQDYEKRLYEMQYKYQELYANADMQMQQAYVSAMERLMTGLKEVAAEVGRERNVDLVIEVSQGSVLYSRAEMDITDEVIKRYNATHK